jgi:hypothetical protein
MDKPRKYKVVRVGNDIYCSSSCDHWCGVTYTVNEVRCYGNFWFEGNCLESHTGIELCHLPRYFDRAVRAAVLTMLETNPRVHEYDRDGNKRYDDMRYHPDGWVQSRIELMRQP